MFGKTGVFCDGLMFGMVTDNTLYFRVDDTLRQRRGDAAWPSLAARLATLVVRFRGLVSSIPSALLRVHRSPCFSPSQAHRQSQQQ